MVFKHVDSFSFMCPGCGICYATARQCSVCFIKFVVFIKLKNYVKILKQHIISKNNIPVSPYNPQTLLWLSTFIDTSLYWRGHFELLKPSSSEKQHKATFLGITVEQTCVFLPLYLCSLLLSKYDNVTVNTCGGEKKERNQGAFLKTGGQTQWVIQKHRKYHKENTCMKPSKAQNNDTSGGGLYLTLSLSFSGCMCVWVCVPCTCVLTLPMHPHV